MANKGRNLDVSFTAGYDYITTLYLRPNISFYKQSSQMNLANMLGL